ncbi:MAG: hypothetical protein RDU20_06075 [Desulfomonilaceae bacterium]|nr:hypothetical protein [Desulfomonilaceae bacterium]
MNKDLHIPIDGKDYAVTVIRRVVAPAEVPRLVVVSRLPNDASVGLLETCVRSIRSFTPEPHELWVVDNNSPEGNLVSFMERSNLNLVLNRTEPLPPDFHTADHPVPADADQKHWGSYANGLALELAVRLIDPQSRYLMSLHMDALPCRSGWLTYLVSKLGFGVGAAGVRMDRARTPEGVLHVLGCVVDFQLFKQLGLDFFPDLPQLDTGDKVTIGLRKAGYKVFHCPNTVWEPELIANIPRSSPLSRLNVDRAFDDKGNVIFLHLGRGVRKSTGEHRRGPTVEEWVRVIHDCILGDAEVQR